MKKTQFFHGREYWNWDACNSHTQTHLSTRIVPNGILIFLFVLPLSLFLCCFWHINCNGTYFMRHRKKTNQRWGNFIFFSEKKIKTNAHGIYNNLFRFESFGFLRGFFFDEVFCKWLVDLYVYSIFLVRSDTLIIDNNYFVQYW